MIPAACPCPRCGNDQTRLGPRGAYPDQPHVRMAECQGCGKDFDVRVTAAGVELAPVIYHGPGSGWDGPPHAHREYEPCVLCDLAAATDVGEPDPDGW